MGFWDEIGGWGGVGKAVGGALGGPVGGIIGGALGGAIQNGGFGGGGSDADGSGWFGSGGDGGGLVGAGMSLYGASKDRRSNRAQLAGVNYRNSPQGIRNRAEKAGFNPLLFVGPGTGTGAGYQPTHSYSSSFAAAGGFIADAFNANEQRKIQLGQLEVENERLRQSVERHTLTANVPGIYGGRNNVRRNTQAVSGASPSPVLGGDGLPELGKPTITSAQDAGSNTYQHPRVMDAEASEARYGDLLQEVTGARNLWKDNMHNSRLQRIAETYGRGVADRVHSRFGSELSKSFADILDEETVGFRRKAARDRLSIRRSRPTFPSHRSILHGTYP